MKRIRTAVIGVGYLGAYHAEKYAKLPQSHLVAVVDSQPAIAEAVAKRFQTKALSDYRDVVDKVDAVSIAVPTPLHFSIAQFFLKNGIHVLLEKPMTATLMEASMLLQLAEQHHCVLQIGHLERFNPALAMLQKQLHHPYFIEAHRLTPFKLRGTDVNVVLDLMIHDIDIVQSLISSPIRHIHANGNAMLSGNIDIANARIEWMNGAVANLTASRISDKTERSMKLFQPENYVVIDFQRPSFTLYKQNKNVFSPEMMQEESVFEKSDALLAEINSFLFAIENNLPPVVSGLAGKSALETALHISALIQEKRKLEVSV